MKTHPLQTMIADDSEDDRFLFGRAVSSLSGLRLAAVTTDGVETLAYLRGCAPYGNRVKFPFPDLLLLDYQMPGYNGLEILASLHKQTRSPKVILWSSAIETINQSRAYELGAVIVCLKPTLPQQLQSILNFVLNPQAVALAVRASVPNHMAACITRVVKRLAPVSVDL